VEEATDEARTCLVIVHLFGNWCYSSIISSVVYLSAVSIHEHLVSLNFSVEIILFLADSSMRDRLERSIWGYQSL
jgi:hypothetical protein